MRRNARVLLAAAALACAAPTLAAAGVAEAEPNNTPVTAQALRAPSGSAEVEAVLGSLTARADDLDFYAFRARAGDVVTIDVEDGYGGKVPVDLYLAVFKPIGTAAATAAAVPPNYRIDRVSDNADGPRTDPRVDNYAVPADGVYLVGLSNYPRFFRDDGTVANAAWFMSGDYRLVISGASPSILAVSIDIRPGSAELAPINPKAQGRIPVAILSSGAFDALAVDPSTLRFGPTGSEPSFSSCAGLGKKGKGALVGEDVDGDGRPDLVCHFENAAAGFRIGDLEGILTGRTTAGEAFEGRGWLRVVPQKGTDL